MTFFEIGTKVSEWAKSSSESIDGCGKQTRREPINVLNHSVRAGDPLPSDKYTSNNNSSAGFRDTSAVD